MRFGNSSSNRYEGKGEVQVDGTNGEFMIVKSVIYIPRLKTNILSFGKLDSQGCDICLRDGFLISHDGQEKLLTKTPKTKMNMHY